MSRSKWAVFVAGVAVGVVLAVVGLGTWGTPQVSAQPKAAEPPRFQLSAWGAAQGVGAAYGAYLTDTTTGEVFLVDRDRPPQSLGKPAPKK
jgi:hypothetical protein